MKGLVFILDGLGDRPCKALDGKTPLQHASTPTLNRLAAKNQSGLMNPLAPGIPVDTHTGVSMLFGVPPVDAVQLKRGPIEAAGIDLDLEDGDLLFRANLSTVEPAENIIIDRRAQRIQQGVDNLCASLQNIDLGNNITASLFAATHHRCVLRFRGPGLSDQISDTDPGGKNVSDGILQSSPLNDSSEARRTADALNQFTSRCQSILSQNKVNLDRVNKGKLPANAVITRGAGQFKHFQNRISDLKLSVSVIAGEATIIGLGKLFGFNTINAPAFTANPLTPIDLKVQHAVDALQTSDLVFVHLKGTDTSAHDRDPSGKSDFINRFDKELGNIDFDNYIVGICADHSTDSILGEHNGDAVPVLIHNPIGRSDLVTQYNEIDCSIGALGRIDAQGFITSVLDAMGCIENFKPTDSRFYSFSCPNR